MDPDANRRECAELLRKTDRTRDESEHLVELDRDYHRWIASGGFPAGDEAREEFNRALGIVS